MRGIVLAAVAESDDGILRTDIVDLLENEGYDRSDASQMINALVGKGEVEYDKPSGIVSAV
jgi:DNA-binding MarR family transcriptional regulator